MHLHQCIPEIIHFPSPSGISIVGSHGGDRGVHGLMVFKKAPRIVTSVPLIVSLQLCYRSWRRFKVACTAWWSSRKRHLQACLQSVRCSVQENAKHHRLCAIVSDCVLHFKLTEGSTKPYDCQHAVLKSSSKHFISSLLSSWTLDSAVQFYKRFNETLVHASLRLWGNCR